MSLRVPRLRAYPSNTASTDGSEIVARSSNSRVRHASSGAPLIQYAPDPFHEAHCGKGLRDQLHAIVQTPVVDDGVAGIAGREENLQIRPDLQGFVRHMAAV